MTNRKRGGTRVTAARTKATPAQAEPLESIQTGKKARAVVRALEVAIGVTILEVGAQTDVIKGSAEMATKVAEDVSVGAGTFGLLVTVLETKKGKEKVKITRLPLGTMAVEAVQVGQGGQEVGGTTWNGQLLKRNYKAPPK